MKLAQLFGQGKTVFSCEVFPPKRDMPVDSIYTTLDGLKDIRPDFISVTFGAGGSKVNQTTHEIASIIENQYHIPAMAHLTCVAADRSDVDQLAPSAEVGRRGKHPGPAWGHQPRHSSQDRFCPRSDLVAYIRAHSNFGVSAACYPEGHLESPDLVSDIRHLKEKVDAGAQHLVSQLFFDNEDFFRFLERCRIAGINVPIEAGIMPVLSKNSIQRMVSMVRCQHAPQADPYSGPVRGPPGCPAGGRHCLWPSIRFPT